MKKCIICGKEFKPNSGVQKVCSDTCRKIRIKNRKKRTILNKKCIVCGEEFKPNSGAQKVCSDTCRDIRVKENKTKLRIENKNKFFEEFGLNMEVGENRKYADKKGQQFLRENPDVLLLLQVMEEMRTSNISKTELYQKKKKARLNALRPKKRIKLNK